MLVTELNRECLLHLFSFLDKDSRRNLARTCSGLLEVFSDPALWPLLTFNSPAELRKNNFILGPALKCLCIRWHSSRVKVCNIEDWMKSSFQRNICSRHEGTVNEFLARVSHRCPNLQSLILSGCGHVTDEYLILILQSCTKLRTLKLENCARVTDKMLQAVTAFGRSVRTLHLDFCRNISQAGLKDVQNKRPSVTLRAERSADMIPDNKPENRLALERTLRKLLQY
ncbi:F-box and leucine-rich protein 22 [Ambystoma mexicanum]|uniref:F-box and leucine-rich protein 22 n=1 Tax=Ambystoma mexicanum TaxID=8296 RepID=UPI0037E7BEAD